MLLQFGRAVAQTTEAMEAHGPCQRVAAFAFVQFRRCLPSERRLFEQSKA